MRLGLVHISSEARWIVPSVQMRKLKLSPQKARALHTIPCQEAPQPTSHAGCLLPLGRL